MSGEESSAKRPLVPFGELSDPRDYIVKEHFEEFADIWPDVSRIVVGFAYRKLVHYPGSLRKRVAVKHFPGLIVTTREELGLPAYTPRYQHVDWASQEAAKYAIELGSLIAPHNRPEIEEWARHRVTGRFTLALVEQLDHQVNNPSA